MALTKVTPGMRTLGTDEVTTDAIKDDAITNAEIKSDAAIAQSKLTEVTAGDLASTLDLSSKTVTLPEGTITPHVTAFDDNSVKEDVAVLGFKIATSESLVKYNLSDQTVDVFEDASGVDAGASTNEIRNSAKYYTGTVAASGGIITTHGSYTVHSFLDTGNTNFVPGSAGNVDLLVVAGGGAGGGNASGTPGDGLGGGGGAGGFLTSASHAVTAQTYTVTVGAGGEHESVPNGFNVHSQGGDSVFDTLTAAGGGGGGAGYIGGSASGRSGGSGGGAKGWYTTTYTGGSGTAGPPRQGYAGGDNPVAGGPSVATGSGGGGAGGPGADGSTASGMTSGSVAGGVGATNDYRTGSAVTYATGGRGAGYTWTGAVDATANSGDGGDGNNFKDGASGIVVIKYTTGALDSYNNITLVSTATTAQAAPTKADFVMTYTDGAGTTTVNTDLKAYASRDDGTTWTQLTLASQGIVATHTILTAHDLDISGQPSGTAMKYKITTHNQSATKETRVHAVSLGWS